MKNRVRMVVVAVLFFCKILQAATCGPTVQPISAGESIWKLTSRVGVTTDVIESLVCLLANSCDIVIGQSDIGSGGVYQFDGTNYQGVTICLKEDIIFTTSAAIELINTNIVTVNLSGHSINGGSHSGTTAFLLTGVQDSLVIKNGSLVDVSTGVMQNISPIYDGLNLAFREMIFFRTNTAISMNNGPANGFTIGALRFVECLFSDAGDVNVLAESTYILNCKFFGDVNPGALILPNVVNTGVRFFQNCSFVGTKGIQLDNASFAFLQDCAFDRTLNTAISIPSVSSVFMRHCGIRNQVAGDALFIGRNNVSTQIQLVSCFVQNCAGAGFVFSIPSILSCDDCIAEHCGGSGFVLTSTTDSNSEISFTNCSALCNSAKGFDYQMCSTNTIAPALIGLVFDNCIATGNAQEGFFVRSPCASTSLGAGVFRKCTATDNGSDAFFFGSAIRDIVIYECTANGNGGDGFDLGGTTTFIDVVNSCAQNNAGVGFRNDAELGANLCLGNTAVYNLGGNYGGIGGFDAVLVNNGPAEIAGGTNWTNASLP
jgi:hypothetical protein